MTWDVADGRRGGGTIHIDHHCARSVPGISPWIIVSISLGLLTTLLFAPDFVFREGGPVELGTALLLLAGAGAFLLLAGSATIRRLWQVPVGLLLLAGREFDLDKSLIEPGILKLRMYTGDAPIDQKIQAFAILCLILYTAFRGIRHGRAPVMRGLRDRARWAMVFVGGGLLAVCAKTIDGIDRKLAPFDISVPPDAMRTFGRLEEGMEFIFAMALLVSVILWSRQRATTS